MDDSQPGDADETFWLTRLVLGHPQGIALTEEEYDEIVQANVGLLAALGVEERYNLFVENYVELERTLLQETLELTVFPVESWSAFQATIYGVNRRLLNLLATARLYLDHLPHDLKAVFGRDSGVQAAVRQETGRVYERFLGYRAMEAVRNYVQHRGLPVSSLAHQTWVQKLDDGTESRVTLIPSLNTARLKADKKFKRSVARELEELGDSVDVRPLVREYFTGVGDLHSWVRNRFADSIEEWQATWLAQCERYISEFKDNLTGLAAVKRTSSGEAETHHIISDVIQRRRWLQHRNSRLRAPLLDVHVTSAPRTRPAEEQPEDEIGDSSS